MEARFVEMEEKEIQLLEEGHGARLAEREEQLRRGIRTALSNNFATDSNIEKPSSCRIRSSKPSS